MIDAIAGFLNLVMLIGFVILAFNELINPSRDWRWGVVWVIGAKVCIVSLVLRSVTEPV